MYAAGIAVQSSDLIEQAFVQRLKVGGRGPHERTGMSIIRGAAGGLDPLLEHLHAGVGRLQAKDSWRLALSWALILGLWLLVMSYVTKCACMHACDTE